MRTTRMTGRERVNRMFQRQDQDSIPRCESWWNETLERWRSEGFAGDLLQFVGNDFQSLSWSDPMPWPGREEAIVEDELTRTYLDSWGNQVRYWKAKSGTPEHVAFGCQTRDDWFETYKPKLFEHETFVKPDASFADWAVGRRNGRWTYLCGLETFEMARRQVGDETFLIALIEDPEWAVDISRSLTDLVLRDFDILIKRGVEPDGVWIYGDMAYRGGPMCSPKMYRELVWPDHKRMADWAHEHGLPFIFHTDGDVNPVLCHYLDAGFDCLQPLEAKAGMDVRKLAPVLGDEMALFGNIDVMVMATNDREAIEHEVQSKLAAGLKTRGYAYHSDHSVPPAVSWDTYRFVIDLVDRYGNYD
ncbi:MAG: uroporphyrinogen decarboxylase family protein [Fimbriimonadales bacterium]